MSPASRGESAGWEHRDDAGTARGRRGTKVKAGTSTLARRYARALLDVSVAQPKIGAPEKVRGDLETLADVLDQHRDLAGIFQNPAVGTETKKKIAAGLAARVQGA